jgi:VanZ family protein
MPPADPAGWSRLSRPLALLTFAYTLVLVVATHYPKPEELLGPNPPSDKTLHFVAYGLLGLLAAATLAATGRWSLRTVGALAAGLAVFAVLDEATQPAFGRTADVWDWAYDLIGLAAGIAVVAVARLRMITPAGGPQ